MNNKLIAFLTLVLLSALNSQLSTIHAQGTAFTYNGRLNENGMPVNGNYEIIFSIYDAENGGNLVAGPQPQPASPTEIVNGLFTARLDFGDGVFTGPARWIELSVRKVGDVDFTTVTPRQELTSSPYAIRAQSAGTATDVSNGSVVKSLNALKDDVTLAPGDNVTITPNGNTLTIASAAGGSSIWALNGSSAYYNGGNVGVGTNNPQTTLDLVGPQHALTMTAFGPDVTFRDTGNTNARSVIQSVGGDLNLFTESYMSGANTISFLKVANNGNVGIGNPSPQKTLDIVSPEHAIAMTANGPDVTFYDNAHGYARDVIQSVSGDLNFFTESYMSGVNPISFLKVANNGNVGIGNPSPQKTLDIVSSQHALGMTAFGPDVTFYDTGNGYARDVIQSVNGDLNIFTESYMSGANLNNYVKIANSGNVSVKNITIRGGADVAEPFAFSAERITAGSVVIIDDEHTGKLKLSSRAYDTRVAGIVSGANGVNPGISLYQDGILEGSQNVALSGRVYVLADASHGAIKAGDLLTTSDTPGYAMKVTNHTKAQGAILGKAMGGLKEGKGLVLVLVTLQ